ncbi:hypothetical protein [Nocardia sp. NPDC057440]|uniref:hypothetical protein n=1 Tax=Nocardia sp. NPDC057440 TaxID=3346134 RepID=UPI00366F816E
MTAAITTDKIATAAAVLQSLGVSARDLLHAAPHRPQVPAFREYVPVVYNAMPDTVTRDGYMAYWRKVLAAWGDRRIDAPTVSEFKHLTATLVSTRVVRRSDRGGHSTKEHFFHAIRCLYRFAVDDGHVAATEDPSAKLEKPRPRPSNRRALPADLLEEICRVAVVTSDDPELDSLILRLHIETACRLEGALNLRLQDLDPTQCLIRLREKETRSGGNQSHQH